MLKIFFQSAFSFYTLIYMYSFNILCTSQHSHQSVSSGKTNSVQYVSMCVHECMYMSSVLFLLDPALLCFSGGFVSWLSNRVRAELILKRAANTIQVQAVNPPSQH